MYRKNVAGQTLPFVLRSSSTGGPLLIASVTIRRTIDGGAQSPATGTISENGNGQYVLALSQADVNGNNIGFLITAPGAIATNIAIVTMTADPTNAITFGLSDLLGAYYLALPPLLPVP